MVEYVEMAKVTAVINTLNEEANLPRVINSVKDFVDEIVVVDMKSDDNTQKIARELGAKVYEHERTNYVEPARNFAISKATSEWVLLLDADERVPHTLVRKLKKLVKQPQANYYRIPRKNIIFKKWIKHSRWWPDYNIRFFKKGTVTWNEVIHSIPMTTGNGIDLKPLEKNAIIHYHYKTLDEYIEKLNRYTSQHAKLKVKAGYKFEWQDVILRPSAEFLSRYFAGKGYKDGLHGLALSCLQAFSELVLYLKVWQLEDFEKQNPSLSEVVKTISRSQSETNYWKADMLLNESKQGDLFLKIKRKFKLG